MFFQSIRFYFFRFFLLDSVEGLLVLQLSVGRIIRNKLRSVISGGLFVLVVNIKSVFRLPIETCNAGALSSKIS